VGKNKTTKFAENLARRCVVEPGKPIFEKIKGNWHEFFGNENPITLELACGRGEYSVGLGRIFPDRNYIGIDVKGARIWKGSGYVEEEGLTNVAFLRIQIHMIDQFFEENEVDEIWIVHPDPRPRNRDERRRLTNNRYLDLYKKLLKPGGVLHLKTDNTDLFEYSLEVLKEREDVSALEYTRDLYQSKYLADHHGIRTRFEMMFHEDGEDIKYLRCRLR